MSSNFADDLDRGLDLLAHGHELSYCEQHYPERDADLIPMLMIGAALYELAGEATAHDERWRSFDAPAWATLLRDVPQQPQRTPARRATQSNALIRQ